MQIFSQNITDQPSMKRQFFFGLSFLLFFFRLPIYESIAAIFWQSASYVFVAEQHEEWSVKRVVFVHIGVFQRAKISVFQKFL